MISRFGCGIHAKDREHSSGGEKTTRCAYSNEYRKADLGEAERSASMPVRRLSRPFRAWARIGFEPRAPLVPRFSLGYPVPARWAYGSMIEANLEVSSADPENFEANLEVSSANSETSKQTSRFRQRIRKLRSKPRGVVSEFGNFEANLEVSSANSETSKETSRCRRRIRKLRSKPRGFVGEFGNFEANF